MQSKLPNVGTTIFSVMTALAVKHNAINLAQGFPDFDCDPQLVEFVSQAMRDGYNQYAPMPGILPIRETISNYIHQLYDSKYDPNSEVTITSGATEALFAAIASVVERGDEVIVFEPCYDSYIPAIQLNGGIAIPIELEKPYFSIDWVKVKEKINKRTKLIILNSPHNPTGMTLKSEDIIQLQELVQRHSFYILSDEVYEHLIYDDQHHLSIAKFPDLKERSFIVFSFGKSLHVTGWKIGYCVAPETLMTEFRKVHQFLTFCTNLPIQVAISQYLGGNPLAKFEELKTLYEQKRNFFQKQMRNTRFIPISTAGTYFQIYDYNEISDQSDIDFARRLTKEFGVATIPVSVFYSSGKDDRLLRFCFAKKEETLIQAIERLCKI